MSARSTIRDRMRSQRSALSPGEIREASEAVLTALTKSGVLSDAESVGLYLPVGGEIDVTPLIDTSLLNRSLVDTSLINKEVRFAAPAVVGESLEFRSISDRASIGDLPTGPFGIAEPVGPAVAVDDLEVVIVPAVAVDERCDRIGQGKGFYDRCFAHVADAATPERATTLVGVVHDFQVVADVGAQAHDVRLDAVVTPTRFFRR